MTTQQKFFLFSEQDDFHEQSGRAEWRADEKVLMLSQNQQPRLSTSNWDEGHMAWQNAKPMMIDVFASMGELMPAENALGFKSSIKSPLKQVYDAQGHPIVLEQGKFTDLHFGGDSRVALGISDEANSQYGLAVFHLRRRWYQTVSLDEAPVRVWTDKQDNSWVLSNKSVFQCSGQPLPHHYVTKADRFEPENINQKPLRVIDKLTLPEEITQPLAICDDGVQLYVLAELVTAELKQQKIFIYSWQTQGEWQALDLPEGLSYICDIYPLEKNRLALMLPKTGNDSDYINRDCPIVALNHRKGKISLELVRQRYPMLSQQRARFASSEDRKVRYISNDGPLELHPLAQARFRQHAAFNLLKVLDSGMPDTQWHKIILEGCIPRSCQLKVSVYCTDEIVSGEKKSFLPQHKPLWVPLTSELPFHKGRFALKPGEHGLFEILLQRPEGEVRELRGRYLQLRLEFSGDGRSSPAIHAIRVYYPRLCWQESFLPQHFHQQKMVDENNHEAANGADLRQRILASLECMLTPIEQGIAAAECLFDPQIAPDQMLTTMAELLGISEMPEQWPEARRRRLVEQAGLLQQRHGTYAGLVLALDIATDGAVAAGKIVPLENFRFRRTLSTILGESFDDKQHPLTLGTGHSGNSIVGDSLILTKKGAREFLALLSSDSYSNEDDGLNDKQRVDEFFDKYAHRITILLHGDAKQWQFNVDEVLQKHAPAHLQWLVKITDHPFVLGLAPLLQIDTYLEQKPKSKRVILNQTSLGREGLVVNESALAFESGSSSEGAM